jgi:AcrR family transcriptional regulator
VTNGRQEKERAFRRNFIAETAESLFLKKGFDGTTMDQLAAAAELSKSTLYDCFQSKDELLFFMHLQDARIGYRCLREGVSSGGTGYAQLKSYGEAFFRYYRQHPAKLLLRSHLDFRGVDLARVAPALQDENARHKEAEIDLLKGILLLGIEDGSLDPGLDLYPTMVQLIYTLHPIAKQTLFPTHGLGKFPGTSCYDSYLKLLLRAVAGPHADQEEEK